MVSRSLTHSLSPFSCRTSVRLGENRWPHLRQLLCRVSRQTFLVLSRVTAAFQVLIPEWGSVHSNDGHREVLFFLPLSAGRLWADVLRDILVFRVSRVKLGNNLNNELKDIPNIKQLWNSIEQYWKRWDDISDVQSWPSLVWCFTSFTERLNVFYVYFFLSFIYFFCWNLISTLYFKVMLNY